MTSDDKPLEHLLSGASAVGLRDSQGVFTLAGRQALTKLAHSQLPRPSAWILKIIQAAVALQASMIVVKQDRKFTQIDITTSESIDLLELKLALLDPTAQPLGYLGHLVPGLRGVGFGDSRPFQIRKFLEGAIETLTWTEHDLELARTPTSAVMASYRFLIELTVDFPAEDRGRTFMGARRSVGRARDEYLDATQYASACPVPLIVDGRRINTLAQLPFHQGKMSAMNLGLGWGYRTALSQELDVLVPSGVRKAIESQNLSYRGLGTDPQDRYLSRALKYEASSLSEGFFILDGDPANWRGSSFIKVGYSLAPDFLESGTKARLSCVYWLKDGVIVDTQALSPIHHPVEVQVYASAEGLPTDLSGLNLREAARAEQERRLACLLPLISPLVGKVGDAARQLRADPNIAKSGPPTSLTVEKCLSSVGWGFIGAAAFVLTVGMVDPFTCIWFSLSGISKEKKEAILSEMIVCLDEVEDSSKNWKQRQYPAKCNATDPLRSTTPL